MLSSKTHYAGDSYLEYSKQVKEDACKWTLFLPKLLIQCLSIWPEINTFEIKLFSSLYLSNITTVLIFHTAYFIENIREIELVAEVFTTVNIMLQVILRKTIIIYYKKNIKGILNTIWTEFWPSKILMESEETNLRRKSKRYFTVVMLLFMLSEFVAGLFAYQALIMGGKNLPIPLKLPFDFTPSPLFELLYVWAACTLIFIPFSVIGFDFFFHMLIWNCATQFKILRIVLQRIIIDKNEPHLKNNNKEKYKEEKQKLIKCIEHHKLLIRVCDDIDTMFRYFLLFQLLDSAAAICFCGFAAVTVPSLFIKMANFSVALILQLFFYCSFGNELQHQSTTVADAAFRCGWHLTDNKEIRKLIMILMQRSQKEQCLSGRGFAIVNYDTCVQVLRMAFSFYTVLEGMKEKTK